MTLFKACSDCPIGADLVKLFVTFVLTTIVGGALGYFFQRRQNDYQWQRTRWEKDLADAQAVFEEVARLLDRRLYRARQLLWSLDRAAKTRDQRLSDYRAVVIEWNENLNRLLALLAIHFSDDVRNVIDNEIGAEFVAVGRSLEQAVRGAGPPDPQLERRLDSLASRIYAFNLNLLRMMKNWRQHLMETA